MCGSGRTIPSTTSPSRTCAVICSSQTATQCRAGAAHSRRIRCKPDRSSGPPRPGCSPAHRSRGWPERSGSTGRRWMPGSRQGEQVFVHPRNPYVRVDALRSTLPVRVELDGVILAESPAPVMVFETGLATRYYLGRTEVDFTQLVASDTVTACPYKGVTSGYWSVRAGDVLHRDLAWAYDFPTRAL